MLQENASQQNMTVIHHVSIENKSSKFHIIIFLNLNSSCCLLWLAAVLLWFILYSLDEVQIIIIVVFVSSQPFCMCKIIQERNREKNNFGLLDGKELSAIPVHCCSYSTVFSYKPVTIVLISSDEG